ncbi:VanZ family protein [Brumimicrobium mesophilum]|uniref:VanZ family protein n=1 Tax=Brumimicrobium mesophilum TaxID=392717 RepID=UPI000D13FFC0|nr:VanZ family protein [Brumimicrobium mesophilum]
MLRFIFPSLIWTALVVVLSLVPSSNVSLNDFQIKNVDKVAHFLMYTFLCLFWAIGLKRQFISVGIRRFALQISFFGGLLIGVLLEFLQDYAVETRSFEIFDLIANGIGCIFGIGLFKIIYKGSYR